MPAKTASRAAEPLLPVELGSGKVKFAQGMKAGRWVFATGLMAQDFKNGIAPEVLAPRARRMRACPSARRKPRASLPISMPCCAPPAPSAPIWCAPTSTTRR